MPTETMTSELKSLGMSYKETKDCKKCGQKVDVWGNGGTEQTFNTESHKTQPLALHLWSCGEKEDEFTGELPQIRGM